MVARLVRDQEVVGSNPVASTKKAVAMFGGGFFVAPQVELPTSCAHCQER